MRLFPLSLRPKFQRLHIIMAAAYIIEALELSMSLSKKMRISQPFLQWHDLPQELLEEIFYFLKDQENLQCRQVCILWRSVAVEAYQKRITLLLNLKFGDGEDSFLLNISTQETQRIHLSDYFRNRRLCDATNGWLVTKNKNRPHGINLLNPLNRIEIQLPTLDTPAAIRILKKKSRIHDQDFLVLALCDNNNNGLQDCKNWRLGGFFRPGDKRWRMIDAVNEEIKSTKNNNDICLNFIPLPECTKPIVSCMFFEGELYAAAENGNILCFKISSRSSDVVFLTEGPVKHDRSMKYLVESLSGNFLLVCRDNLWEYLENVYGMKPSMEVYTLSLETKEWRKVSNLGEQALFVSSGGSKAVHTGAISGHWLRSNCIYFNLDSKYVCLYDLETNRMEILHRCRWWESQFHWIVPDL